MAVGGARFLPGGFFVKGMRDLGRVTAEKGRQEPVNHEPESSRNLLNAKSGITNRIRKPPAKRVSANRNPSNALFATSLNRPVEDVVRVKKRTLKRKILATPERIFVLPADRPVLVVVEIP